MGYSHNWTTHLPEPQLHPTMMAVERDILRRFGGQFDMQLADCGGVILHHRSGEAEGFTIGPSDYDGRESCKTDRGLAEVAIAELLWRSLFAIRAAGGTMTLTSDWLYAGLTNDGQLDPDAALSLAVLLRWCGDLWAGRELRIVNYPRAWPDLGPRDSVNDERRRMEHDYSRYGYGEGCRVLFGIRADGEPDYNVQHAYGSGGFTAALHRHCTMANLEHARPVLRGFLFHKLVVNLDGEVIAGTPHPFEDHPEVARRQVDVLPLVPSAQWLAEAVTHRAGEGAAA